MSATVTPPKVLPTTMLSRGTGATKVSLRKPNWRSQSKPIPEKIDVKSTVIPITPGAMNCR